MSQEAEKTLGEIPAAYILVRQSEFEATCKEIEDLTKERDDLRTAARSAEKRSEKLIEHNNALRTESGVLQEKVDSMRATTIVRENEEMKARMDELNQLVARADQRAAARLDGDGDKLVHEMCSNAGIAAVHRIPSPTGGGEQTVKRSLAERVEILIATRIQRKEERIQSLVRDVAERDVKIAVCQKAVEEIRTKNQRLLDEIGRLQVHIEDVKIVDRWAHRCKATIRRGLRELLAALET